MSDKGQQFKELMSSPWLRVVQILLAVFVSLVSWTLLTAKEDLEARDLLNKRDIEAVEEKISSVEGEVDELQTDQAVIINELKYIREGIDRLYEAIDKE